MEDSAHRLAALCRGDARRIAEWLRDPEWAWFLSCCLVILLGCGSYGAALGLERSPRQALHSSVKFPLLVLLTVACNAVLNGMLAQVLGLRIGFRQATLVLLMGFTIAALVLGSLAPVALFLLTSATSSAAGDILGGHVVLKLAHVIAIAGAGVIAHLRLWQLLCELGGCPGIASRVLSAWLAGNLFLGAQLAWTLRPFIGSPLLPVEFLRRDAFEGSFYENVYRTLNQAWG